MLTYIIYPMIKKQKKITSGEISQISQVVFQKKCCNNKISETLSDQDTKLTWMIDI